MLLELHILGTVQIHAAGHEFPVGEPRQQTALAALSIDAGRTVLVDTLVDRVWGDAPPRQARRSLQAHIARIRRSLAQAAAAAGGGQDQPLVRDAGGYRLDVDPHRVDLLRFRALLESARPAEIDDHVRAASLRAALGLWRGDPLSGPTGSWAERIRHSVRAEYVDAVVAWAAAEIRIGNADAVLGRLTELADEHPLLETATATLMRALYAAGRAAEALRRYDHIRRGLRDELGADPGPRLRAVHEAVLRHDLPLATAARTVPAQLPADVAAFTGRAGELAELDGLSAACSTPPRAASTIVCVTGTAGVGKTALAVHWAHRVRDRFPDGQLYVDLRGYDPEQPVAPADALAAFLHRARRGRRRRSRSRLDERAARYRSELAGRRMLVVLDNAATVDQVRPLLPGGSTCAGRGHQPGQPRRPRRPARGPAGRTRPAARAPTRVALLRRLIGPRVDAEPGCRGRAGAAVRPAAARPAGRRRARRVPARPARWPSCVAELRDRAARAWTCSARGGDQRAAVRAVFSWSLRHLRAGGRPRVRAARPAPRRRRSTPTRWPRSPTSPLDGARPLLDALVRAHLVAGDRRRPVRACTTCCAPYAASLAGERRPRRAPRSAACSTTTSPSPRRRWTGCTPAEARRRPAVAPAHHRGAGPRRSGRRAGLAGRRAAQPGGARRRTASRTAGPDHAVRLSATCSATSTAGTASPA